MSKNAFAALTTVSTYDIITFAKMNKHSIVRTKIVSAEHAASDGMGGGRGMRWESAATAIAVCDRFYTP